MDREKAIKENPNNQPVYLVHTGDPEKEWDPEDPDVKYGRKPKGDPDDAVIHYLWNGEDGAIRPGDKIMTTFGLANRIISAKTMTPELRVLNRVTGLYEKIIVAIAPPLDIVRPEYTSEKRKTAIGQKLEGVEAGVVKMPAKRRKVELPADYEVVQHDPKPMAGHPQDKPPAPGTVTKAQLTTMGTKALLKMAAAIGIEDVSKETEREEIVGKILGHQEQQ